MATPPSGSLHDSTCGSWARLIGQTSIGGHSSISLVPWLLSVDWVRPGIGRTLSQYVVPWTPHFQPVVEPQCVPSPDWAGNRSWQTYLDASLTTALPWSGR